jgi:hypothetical protein
MSLVEGFQNRVESYIRRGLIYSRQPFKSDNTISSFISGLFQMMNQSESCFVVMAVYFDRLMQKLSPLITENNLHRLIFISGMLALKFQDDFSYKNSYFAQISGISNKEINDLESNFLTWIEYHLFVQTTEYENHYKSLLITSSNKIS